MQSVAGHRDGAREVRSMVLACLPVPPMPMIVSREARDTEGGQCIEACATSSHDVIAHLLNLAASRGDGLLNRDREARQIQANERLLQEIDSMEGVPAHALDERAWTSFARFTTMYIACFSSAGSPLPDCRFLQPSDVPQGHPVALQAADHARGHDALFGPVPGVQGPHDARSYEVSQAPGPCLEHGSPRAPRGAGTRAARQCPLCAR